MTACVFRPRIILCLLISEMLIAAAEASVPEISGVVGGSVTFPARVPVSGNLMYNSDTIGQVLNNQSDTNIKDKFIHRLQWNDGLFTLADLRSDDSGRYTLESTKEHKLKQDYQLQVYARVSAPHVMNTTSSSSEFCSLLCSVPNLRGLKLSWYEDGVLLNYSSNNNNDDNNNNNASDVTLTLHLQTNKINKRTYSCVASNPVSNQTTTIDLTHLCPLNLGHTTDKHKFVLPVVVCVLLVSVVILMCVCMYRRKQYAAIQQTGDGSEVQDTHDTGQNEEIVYSVINHKNQTNLPERSSEEACPLTTVYDQLKLDRMTDGVSNRVDGT